MGNEPPFDASNAANRSEELPASLASGNPSHTHLSPYAFLITSWLTAAAFFYTFGVTAGYPPPPKLQTSDLIYGASALLFLFLPFFSKLKVGMLLELEREIEKTKEEVKHFKSDIRNSIAMLTNTFSSVSAMNNHVLIYNTPSESQLRRASQAIARSSSKSSKDPDDLLNEILQQSDFDATLALARTRIEIERLLRSLLDKSTTLPPENARYASVRKLFDALVAGKPNLQTLIKPFTYVIQVCDAAIHAQTVSEGKAKEALELGAQIIAVLRDELALKEY